MLMMLNLHAKRSGYARLKIFSKFYDFDVITDSLSCHETTCLQRIMNKKFLWNFEEFMWAVTGI